MIRLLAAFAILIAPLGACAPLVPPVGIAERTTLDEKTGIAIETAYTAAALAATLVIKSGKVNGSTAARIAVLDNRAYAAVGATRAAYDAGNASSYVQTAIIAVAALRELVAALKEAKP